MKSLDRNRSYGTIIPPLPGGAMFEQDGVLFGANGFALVDEPVATGKPRGRPPKSATPETANSPLFARPEELPAEIDSATAETEESIDAQPLAPSAVEPAATTDGAVSKDVLSP